MRIESKLVSSTWYFSCVLQFGGVSHINQDNPKHFNIGFCKLLLLLICFSDHKQFDMMHHKAGKVERSLPHPPQLSIT